MQTAERPCPWRIRIEGEPFLACCELPQGHRQVHQAGCHGQRKVAWRSSHPDAVLRRDR